MDDQFTDVVLTEAELQARFPFLHHYADETLDHEADADGTLDHEAADKRPTTRSTAACLGTPTATPPSKKRFTTDE